jgi:hypothetical protein
MQKLKNTELPRRNERKVNQQKKKIEVEERF